MAMADCRPSSVIANAMAERVGTRIDTSIFGISSKSSVGGIAKKDRQSRRLADASGNKSTGADKPALPH
jgi:hypothetical protein